MRSDKTADIGVLIANWASTWNSKFGNGNNSHPFILDPADPNNSGKGTGLLDISSIITWSVGRHIIEFKQAIVDKGGKIFGIIYTN